MTFTDGENLNNNSTIKEDTTSAVYKAMKYGETLGVTTGRLMLYSEATALESANSDILYGKNGKSSGEYLNYWLGSEYYSDSPWVVYGGDGCGLYDCWLYYDGDTGVRPVVEILKSNLS